jgi:hypothetical protein
MTNFDINQSIRFDMPSLIGRLLQQEHDKRIVPRPRRAMDLLKAIDFCLEKNILGIAIPKTTMAEDDGNEIRAKGWPDAQSHILVPKQSLPPLIPKRTQVHSTTVSSVIGNGDVSTTKKSIGFNFVEFEAPLDPWEAIQDDMHELRSVLK